MLERLSWKRLIFELILCCIPALILGLIFGWLPWFLLAAVTGLLAWHFWNLLRLSWWLWVGRSMTPPPGHGSWEPLLYGLHLMQMRNKKRRKELGNLIKRFRSGAESLPDAVVLITEEGAIFWCNGLAQQLLSLRWPDDNGQNILNLLRYPEFAHYLSARDFGRPLNLVLNSGRHLELRVMPYSKKQLLMVARDMTQMHQLEGARRSFFANVSHELRTPLTVLKGYMEMMDQLEGSAQEKALHTMREQTQRMEGLVNQLLTLSRIEASPQGPLREAVDLPMMLRVVEQEALALSHGRQRLHFEVDQQLKVLGSEEQLRSAVSNLVYNAVNHTPEGTVITVRWQRAPGGARFSVEDNGPGIAPQHIPRLTERFYRVDKARSRQTGGSGLGLAIVKHAVNHHDSRLEIASEPGQTRFSFLLPERLLAV